ncbi:NAD(P)/FAD-dependent oxidoreductase [Aquitalea pelogenes]|uniref:NAD(P)/FAD-dependent oxidoreductase n=1 Tax=Aquitalea pelogenes TaxID=1293573 RepID=UPI0035AE5081
MSLHKKRIVIVGGGAGGLVLASRLGRLARRSAQLDITLVDASRSHIWKPLLHEIAAGSMNPHREALDYLAQAKRDGFRFCLGRMTGLNRQQQTIQLAATADEQGRPLIPARTLPYDILVMAIGSTTNDFATPGVAEHAICLNTPAEASRFHQQLVNACIRASLQNGPLRAGQLHVTIIGAGATGVELAAELRNTTRELVAHGRENINPDRDIRLTLIEAGPRILPALPDSVVARAHRQLENLQVEVLTGDRVSAVDANAVHTASGRNIASELVVWAAGVQAPAMLAGLDGLASNRLNQLLVRPTLQTTLDDKIYALGDCAACPDGSGWVPPRAQAASQQAELLYHNIRCQLAGKPLQDFRYRDLGSLISLGRYSTVGSLMSSLSRRSLFVHGQFARLMYLSLYHRHQLTLFGWLPTVLTAAARLLQRRTQPLVKLH